MQTFNQSFTVRSESLNISCSLWYLLKESRMHTSQCPAIQNVKELTSDCPCPLEHAVLTNHRTILYVMKHSLQPSNQRRPLDELVSDLGPEVFERSEQGLASWGNYPGLTYHHNPFVINCHLPCIPLTRTFSNDGIGYTFNAKPFEDFYKADHPYLKIAREALQMDTPRQTLISTRFVLRMPDDIQVAPTDFTGAKKGLTPVGEVEEPVFIFDLHDQRSMANLKSDAVKLRPGFRYDLLISPKVLMPGSDLRQLSLEDRECKYRDEGEKLMWHKV